MVIVCAWCKRVLGDKEPLENGWITHTICDDCISKLKTEINHEQKINLLTVLRERYNEIDKIKDPSKKLQYYRTLEYLIKIIDEIMKEGY